MEVWVVNKDRFSIVHMLKGFFHKKNYIYTVVLEFIFNKFSYYYNLYIYSRFIVLQICFISMRKKSILRNNL